MGVWSRGVRILDLGFRAGIRCRALDFEFAWGVRGSMTHRILKPIPLYPWLAPPLTSIQRPLQDLPTGRDLVVSPNKGQPT